MDYSLRLKRELGPTTWVAAYANNVMEYIPSRRVLKEGGYEAEIFSADLAGATWAPSVEDLIVSNVHQLVTTVRGASAGRDSGMGLGSPTQNSALGVPFQPMNHRQDADATKARDTGTPPAGYPLAWSDEFDGTALDLSKWSHRGPGRRRDALNVADAVSVSDGQLTITTYTSGGKHSTGMIGTEGKFERRFGYWEARVRFEGSPGMWSAFWIQTPTFGRPPNDPAAAGTEIDVIEHRVRDQSGQDISGPAHHALHIGGAKSQSHVTEDLKLGTGFHTFGVQWTETEYHFFVDGKMTWTMSVSTSLNSARIVAPPTVAHHDLESVMNTIACGPRVQFTSSPVVVHRKIGHRLLLPFQQRFPVQFVAADHDSPGFGGAKVPQLDPARHGPRPGAVGHHQIDLVLHPRSR